MKEELEAQQEEVQVKQTSGLREGNCLQTSAFLYAFKIVVNPFSVVMKKLLKSQQEKKSLYF